MIVEVTWIERNMTQVLELVETKCSAKTKDSYFTMYSPIYEAIENGSFCIDLGYGVHSFIIRELC